MNSKQALKKYFGFDTFRPGQEEVIESLLQGRSTLGMLPTGSGKSLCYQLPAYMMNKTAVIISPLLSLMQDQAEQLRMRGEKSVLALNSFLSIQQKREALHNLNRYRFIFLSPEMLTLDRVMDALKHLNIGLFVIDEAHCISQWGYDFRPDYLHLGSIRKELGNPLTLALTATATEEARKDIKEKLLMEDAAEIVSSVDRENIAYFVEPCPSYEDKLTRLSALVRKLSGSLIIYFSSRKTAESTAAFLREEGIKSVDFYHGGMEQEQRMLIQQQFITGQLQIICATSAFGMGVNKQDVRAVIHFQLPVSMESYVQEVGRAGRDGMQSAAVLLYCEGDEGLPLHLLEQQLPSDSQIEAVCTELAACGQIPDQPEAFAAYSVTEGQWNYMRHYLKDHREELGHAAFAAAFKSYTEVRRSANKQRFSALYHWVNQTGCRRTGILAYFNEAAGPVITICCDQCGAVLKQAVAESDPEAPVDRTADWKRELAFLLLKEPLSYEK